MTYFDKVLIANRGEIAIRVIRACRGLGIRTVAVYSEADAGALHVRMADEAFCVGPPPSRESYLVGERILEVARQTGAQAIHPGYGFLSENATFRRACEEVGVTFIGPPADAMHLMGEKTLARRTMQAAGVPVVPGTTEPIRDHAELLRVAESVGYPVMLKAASGGGGKGMRVVATPGDLVAAFEGATREARSSFGDDAVYIEKAIVGPRHIEVQVFADRHGNVVYVGDRECSVQRRHQKVIEEAPAPNLRPETRRAMGEMACKAAAAVGYEGAGTVECLVDAHENYYFLEMNTRLQVEHCVTEEAFGVDLVRAQLAVAAGHPLPWRQEDLVARRAAMEFRLYAEDPAQNYQPSPGPLLVYRPPRGPGVRVDDGVEEGDVVSSLYDPMVAKLIVSGTDRAHALERARTAIREYDVVGIQTNLRLLAQICDQPAFVEGRYTTEFLKTFTLAADGATPAGEDVARVLAALAARDGGGDGRAVGGAAGAPAKSPWATDGMRRGMGGDRIGGW
jgi:acetyl-CoA carboxylase biotin carboxylase subunit